MAEGTPAFVRQLSRARGFEPLAWQQGVASLRAMKMGKHCFTQKPLVQTVSEAREMRHNRFSESRRKERPCRHCPTKLN